MATWGEILAELQQQAQTEGNPDFDRIRRRALRELFQYTERNVILYCSGSLQKPELRQGLMITDEDLEGFMEVFHKLDRRGLDLILHSPGGIPEAAESIVRYLRSKFDDVRVIVPQFAMSAATMVACSANRLLMGRHSQLGPIDPQIVVQTELGVRPVAAWAVLEQFEQATKQAGDPAALAVWYPILKQYGPALLVQCKNAITYATEIVAEWLGEFMFAERPDRDELAARVANTLADHRTHLAHGRPLHRDYLRQQGMVIDDLEDDQELQERVLTIYHAFMHSLSSTTAFKIIENHHGRGYIRLTAAPAQTQKKPRQKAGSKKKQPR